MRYAADRGMGVVVMEPLKGGRLAGAQPADVRAVWERAAQPRPAYQWALRFVWDDPGVSMLLSGMSTMQHVVDNVAAAQSGVASSLTSEELALIDEVRAVYRARIRADCTGCKYCMPCPSRIDIPGVLALLNKASMFDDVAGAKAANSASLLARAATCSRCGTCEALCPQQLRIRELLDEAVDLLCE